MTINTVRLPDGKTIQFHEWCQFAAYLDPKILTDGKITPDYLFPKAVEALITGLQCALRLRETDRSSVFFRVGDRLVSCFFTAALPVANGGGVLSIAKPLLVEDTDTEPTTFESPIPLIVHGMARVLPQP